MADMLRRSFLAATGAAFAAAPRIRTGCQTRSYYVPNRDRAQLNAALDDIAAAGFEGFETNQMCLAADFAHPGPLRADLARRKLELLGLHVGGNLHAPAAAPQTLETMRGVAQGAKNLGAEMLVVSAAAVRNMEGSALQVAMRQKAVALEELGKWCRAFGVRLAAHNHTEETLRNFSEFRLIAEATSAANVSLMVDVGHTGVTGVDPVPFLHDYGRRVAGIHVRDYRDGKHVALGKGVVNLKGVAKVLHDTKWSGWVILELEAAAGAAKPPDAVRAARKYLREEMGM